VTRIISTVNKDRRYLADKTRAEEARRIFELGNNAYSLYVSRDMNEKATLLNSLLLNCSIDADNVVPTYRRPFDMISKRAGLEEWSQYLATEV
jgi:hypothetical protein